MSEMFVTAFESVANDMKKINYEGVDNLQSVLDRLNKEKARQKEIFKA
jgi:CRISPR/Cas system CSM-associated protein Csm4 (group 5 of RAMP superfamily)